MKNNFSNYYKMELAVLIKVLQSRNNRYGKTARENARVFRCHFDLWSVLKWKLKKLGNIKSIIEEFRKLKTSRKSKSYYLIHHIRLLSRRSTLYFDIFSTQSTMSSRRQETCSPSVIRGRPRRRADAIPWA